MSEYVGFGWRDRNAKKATGRAADPLSGNSSGAFPLPLAQAMQRVKCLTTSAAVKNAMTWHPGGGGASSAIASRMYPRANVCVRRLRLIVFSVASAVLCTALRSAVCSQSS